MVIQTQPITRPRSAPHTTTIHIPGPVGSIALLLDQPDNNALGVAVIAHPQPLMGGSPRHIIPHRLAQATRQLGWLVLRPSFRGVGTSDGHYDHGVGESEDMLAVIASIREKHPKLPLALIGFSFGAYVMSKVAAALVERNVGAQIVILAGLPVGDVPGGRYYDTGLVPTNTRIIHGENDDHALLAAIMDWAHPQRLPVTVIPGSDHFFSGELDTLASLVVNTLRADVSGLPSE